MVAIQMNNIDNSAMVQLDGYKDKDGKRIGSVMNADRHRHSVR